MAGGTTPRDESVQFSLEELKKLEDDRVRQEREAAEAHARDEAAARERDELRQRTEIEARERDAAELRERERERRREEGARLEAMQRAIVEQGRISVEARARAEEAERERRYELELLRAHAEAERRPGAAALLASALGGAALCLALCLALYFGVSRPATDSRIAELDRAVTSAERRADGLERRALDDEARIGQLDKSLEAAQAELTRPKAIPAPKPPSQKLSGKRGGVEPVRTKGPFDGPPCVDDHDPLCGHIGGR